MKNNKPSVKNLDQGKMILSAILIISILVIIPLIVMGIYNRPSADDYAYAKQTHMAVQEGGGLKGILTAAWKTDIKFYNTWQGLYASAFLLALQPGIFGEGYYALTTIILLIFSFLCLFIGVNVINKYYLKFSRLFTLTATMFLLAFIVLWLPCPKEGLYWYCGAASYYLWAFVNILIVSILIVVYNSNGKTKKIVLTVCASILSFLASGGDQVCAFSNILILFFLLVFLWKKSKHKYSLLPLLTACIGFVIMYIAPGTQVRKSALIQQSVPKTIIASALEFIRNTESWISVAFLFTLILMIPVAIRFSKQNSSDVKIKFPWQSLLASIIVICGMLCVPFYSMGSFGEGRLTNVIWITYIIMGWMNYFLIFRWAYCNKIVTVKRLKIFDNKYIRFVAVVCIVGAIAILPQSGTYSSTLYAIKEIGTGTAKAVATEMDKRFEKLNDSTTTDVTLDGIDYYSRLLSIDEISTDTEDWRNVVMSRYYGKDSVKAKDK